MATNHYLEGLGVQIGRGQEPSTAEMLYAITCTLDERLEQLHNVMIRMQMTGEEMLAEARHIRAALNAAQDTRDYAYTPGDRDENGETDIERSRRQDDEEDPEPDVDDEPPPDYGPPGSGAVITEYD